MSANELEALGRAILVQAAQAAKVEPIETVSVTRSQDGREWLTVSHWYEDQGVGTVTSVPLVAVYAAIRSEVRRTREAPR